MVSIEVGKEYVANIRGRIVFVLILKKFRGGWLVKNQATGEVCRITSAQIEK